MKLTKVIKQLMYTIGRGAVTLSRPARLLFNEDDLIGMGEGMQFAPCPNAMLAQRLNMLYSMMAVDQHAAFSGLLKTPYDVRAFLRAVYRTTGVTNKLLPPPSNDARSKVIIDDALLKPRLHQLATPLLETGSKLYAYLTAAHSVAFSTPFIVTTPSDAYIMITIKEHGAHEEYMPAFIPKFPVALPITLFNCHKDGIAPYTLPEASERHVIDATSIHLRHNLELVIDYMFMLFAVMTACVALTRRGFTHLNDVAFPQWLYPLVGESTPPESWYDEAPCMVDITISYIDGSQRRINLSAGAAMMLLSARSSEEALVDTVFCPNETGTFMVLPLLSCTLFPIHNIPIRVERAASPWGSSLSHNKTTLLDVFEFLFNSKKHRLPIAGASLSSDFIYARKGGRGNAVDKHKLYAPHNNALMEYIKHNRISGAPYTQHTLHRVSITPNTLLSFERLARYDVSE